MVGSQVTGRVDLVLGVPFAVWSVLFLIVLIPLAIRRYRTRT